MRMKGVHVFALVGLVIGATLFGWSDADAVLCVKSKKGVIAKVTIRDGACKGKETVGDPTVLLGLPTTTTSPTTTTTLAPSRRASRIVDSAGKEVAWVAISPAGGIGHGVWALRTTDDGAITFPMSSNGPSLVVEGTFDDFQNHFLHTSGQCTGERFALSAPLEALALLSGADLLRPVYPNLDGKTGYFVTFDGPTVAGSLGQEDFTFTCSTPSDVGDFCVQDEDCGENGVCINHACPPPAYPPTATCDDGDFGEKLAVTDVGSAFPCDPKKLGIGSDDPTLQCSCIRCCVLRSVVKPFKLLRMHTVDLGLGNSTPPFRIEP
jgi:hypothetical protein